MTRLSPLFLITPVAFVATEYIAIPAEAEEYDVALNDGRVIDPDTDLDPVRHVGIRDGRIVTVTATPLEGRRTLDVSGRIVAPGFVGGVVRMMSIMGPAAAGRIRPSTRPIPSEAPRGGAVRP